MAELVAITLRHERFLRAVVLISAAHPEVQRRGSRYSQELGEAFGEVVLGAGGAIAHPDPVAAVRFCFSTVFAASIIRVAYGAGFATRAPVDSDTFVTSLGETAARSLLADVPG